jgi:hypothetical protein
MAATPHIVRSNLEIEALRNSATRALARPELSAPEREQWQRIIEALPVPQAKAQETRPVTVPALPKEVAIPQVKSALQRQFHLALSAPPSDAASPHPIEPQVQHALNKGFQHVVSLLAAHGSAAVAAKLHFIVSQIASNASLRSSVLIRLAQRSTSVEHARVAVDEAVRYLQIPPRQRPVWGAVHEDHEDIKEVHLEQQLAEQLPQQGGAVAAQAPMYQNVPPGNLSVAQPVISTGGSLGIGASAPVAFEELTVTNVSNESSGGGGSGGDDSAGEREREAAREQREKKNEKDKKKARQRR